MITEELKVKKKEEDKTARLQELEELVKIGLSAERLIANQDWLRIKSTLDKALDELNKNRLQSYDSAITQAFTTDQCVTAVLVLKSYRQTAEDVKFYVETPEREAKRGKEAQDELAQLRGGNSNG